MLKTENYLRDITQRLSWFVGDVRIRNSLGLHDVNVFAENFFCELLNLILDLQLVNVNRIQRNHPAIDLADDGNRVAVQVTSTGNRQKISHVLEQFYGHELDRKYDRLIVVLIAPEKPVYKKNFLVQQRTTDRVFSFNPDRDIWDLQRLVQEISALDDGKIERIAKHINAQMSDPLRWVHPNAQQRQEKNHRLPSLDLQLFGQDDSPATRLEGLLEAVERELSFIRTQNSEKVRTENPENKSTTHLGKLWDILHTMENSLDDSRENIWHQLFSDNEWVLAQIFDQPHKKLKEKAYVGGKDLGNHHGNECDFVYQSTQSRNIVLIEIKNPCAPIVGHEYRATFGLSHELTGALNQVLNYRDHLVKEYYVNRANTTEEFQAYNPRCVIIIGRMSSLEIEQVAAFENFRNTLNNVTIITFDEIVNRTRYLLGMLTGLS